jgi:glycosyltransferase involved in cell wall biosynthesis
MAKIDSMLVALSVNTAWNIANFRSGLISALGHAGYKVVALAPRDEHVARIPAAFVPLPMDAGGTNPISDLLLVIRYWRYFRRERPRVFLSFTIKPNVFGGVAARLAGVSQVANVAGLGSGFIGGGWIASVQLFLYRIALKHACHVFFQNKDDLTLFRERRVIRHDRTSVLPGSGVDLSRFVPTPDAGVSSTSGTSFLMIARLLHDKGVVEYVTAAATLRKRYGEQVRFFLLGECVLNNPTAIDRVTVEAWHQAGTVCYLGFQTDVRAAIASSDVVVLPSYREGAPRSLLEAAAMGKPTITTDAVGCRDVVLDGVTGYLCKPRDADSLYQVMEKFHALDALARKSMGREARRFVEKNFDESLVIDAYLQALARAVSSTRSEAPPL